MPFHHLPLLNEPQLAAARRELGPAFPAILGYFRQDGLICLGAIENAMRDSNPTAMVRPAHKLKGDSRQVGAECLSELALHIEMTARRCIEERDALPGDLAKDVQTLRPLFHDTTVQIERVITAETSALANVATPSRQRPAVLGQRPIFGRRAL